MRILRYCIFLLLPALSWTQTSIEGTIRDQENGDPIIFGTVALYRNGVLVTGTETDENGNYAISNLDPGTYNVNASYVGYQAKTIEGVILQAGRNLRLDIEISSGTVLDQVVVVEYKVPLVEQDNTTTGGIVTGEQIRNLPMKNINSLAATASGVSSFSGEAVAIRGSRTNATDYYVDGIRVSANLVPQTEIDQLQVITGGVEARYGDVTGGIISITTKGPSETFQLGAELETSQYLDAFGYNELNINLSGPIWKNKKTGRSILGYRLAGRYLNQLDDSPGVLPNVEIKPSVLEEIEADPLLLIQNTLFSRAEFLHDKDVNFVSTNSANNSHSYSFTGKLDARLTDNIDMTFSGNYTDSYDRFSAGRSFAVLNSQNNPVSTGSDYRVNVRYRHRFLHGNRQSGFFRNATLVINGSQEYSTNLDQDYRHRDNFFQYGHVGKFDFAWVPVEGESEYSQNFDGLAHAGYLQVLEGPFTPSPHNPVLANYNNHINQNDFTQYVAYNGFLSSNYNAPWGFFNNAGSVYNNYSTSELNKQNINASFQFDLFPGGSDRGRHSIEIGVNYEKRESRSWAIAPYSLWLLARQQANRHIIGVDTTQIIGQFQGRVVPVLFEEFARLVVDLPGAQFYKAIRELTGTPLGDYVNVDAMNPEDLNLSLFSPLELNDNGLIGYNGYDYLGNKTSGVEFNDFFTGRDANGRRTFLNPAFEPIYGAAYIQDKFSYKDIIFRLGLRVDYYDANTRVLRDPYSLYPIMTAADFFDRFGGERPATIGDGFKVYVERPNSTNVKAYRDGDQWYFPNGTAANDGNVIFGGEIVYPQYYDKNVNDIKSDDYDPNISFEDYKPTLSWMPRFAVSFPISEKSNFFANYDVLVQRPPSNSFTSPLSWYYFEDRNYGAGNPINNANLKPEKTINYEVGFQQLISPLSAMKINAFYKELRDMIQQRTYLYLPSPISTYTTYGNLDFATIKGISLEYHLRQSQNLALQANYTLQIANGTGSDANSQGGLTTRGNIRTLSPIDRDERHSLKVTMDYRYGSGRSYNGPRLFDLDLLANTGVNLQGFIVSGRPYTQRIRATPFGGTGFAGSFNGARKPWTYTLDLRLDKTVVIPTANQEKPLFLNLSLRVLNLLNTANPRAVYPVTGSAYDSGYLQSQDGEASLVNIGNAGQQVTEMGRDVQAYTDAYYWMAQNTNLFYGPRRIFLSCRINL